MAAVDHTYVIAEAGVNHNGDRDLAYRLIDAAKVAGADAVKFQTFRAESLATQAAARAAYQRSASDDGGSQLAMLKQLELPYEWHGELVDHCSQRGIGFLSTPFDRESLRFLAGVIGLDTIKLPSGEITNGPLLLAAARTGCRVILSTGMSTLGEVEEALGVLAFGYTMPGGERPAALAFRRAYISSPGQIALREKVTLLHCTTEYPAPAVDVNLRAMDTLRTAFGLSVGLSDHTQGVAVAIAAAARGAAIVEKHFTLDRQLPGPDHKASLEPGELGEMIEGIRTVERALGDGVKGPRPSELSNMAVARKSLVAGEDVAAGEAWTETNLVVMRPGTGCSPMRYWDFLGARSERAYHRHEVVTDSDAG